jgi:hypothetical protein
MRTSRRPIGALAFCLAALSLSQVASAGAIDYVIHVSVDGLRPDVITNLGPDLLPNFFRIRTKGAFTDNARSDYDITVTLPNHTTQLTGRSIMGRDGHNWTDNSDPAPGVTLHTNKGSYVAGVFDVVHDHSRRTGAYVGKTKFSLFDLSWDAVHGARDTVGPDDGRDKIDAYRYDGDTASLMSTFVDDMEADPFNYAFIHLMDPDATGHSSGWDPRPGSDYCNTIRAMDAWLGELFKMIDRDAQFTGRTAMIITADHGGIGWDHSDPELPEDFTIPMYVWGPGITAGADLYSLNTATRLDPGTGRPPYSEILQPIRNGEAANLALDLLGLGPVPGSTINASQDLIVPEPAVLAMLAAAALVLWRPSHMKLGLPDHRC